MDELDAVIRLDSENIRFEHFSGKYQSAGQERDHFLDYL